MAQVLIAPPDQSGPLREILGFVADAMGVEVKDHAPDGITIDGTFHYAEDYREPEQDENPNGNPRWRPRHSMLRSNQWRLRLILPRHLRMQ